MQSRIELIERATQNNALIRYFNDDVLKHHLRTSFYDHMQAKAVLSLLLSDPRCDWEITDVFLRQEFERLKKIQSYYIFQDYTLPDIDKNLQELSLYCFDKTAAMQKYEDKRAEEARLKRELADNQERMIFNLNEGRYHGKYYADTRSPKEHSYYTSFFKYKDKPKQETPLLITQDDLKEAFERMRLMAFKRGN